MPTIPGTSVATGAGTVVLLPDGSNLPWTSVLKYSLSSSTITFVINGSTDIVYDFLTAEMGGLAMKALQSIPANPASFYILLQLIPTFAALIMSPETGVAAGGDVVSIKGVGFVDGCLVNWNGALTPVTFVDSTEIRITTPAGTANQIFFPLVINPDKAQSTTLNAFKYT